MLSRYTERNNASTTGDKEARAFCGCSSNHHATAGRDQETRALRRCASDRDSATSGGE